MGQVLDPLVTLARWPETPAGFDAVATSVRKVRRFADQAGRDPDKLLFVSRGMVHLRGQTTEPRRPLTGTVEQVRADVERIAGTGLHELFLDLNFDEDVAGVAADPGDATRRANLLLDAMADRVRR